MQKSEILNHFENEAKEGIWDNLYNPNNPSSYSFINRIKKSLDSIEDLNDKKIIDLGCGTGALIPFVLNNNAHYTGIDNSVEMISVIKEKFFKEFNEGKIKLKLNNFIDIKNNEKFDIIIGLGFIEYFDEYEVIFDKISLLLNNNGQVILSFQNNSSFDILMVKLLYMPRLIVSFITDKKTILPPKKFWSPNSAKRIFKKYNFKSIKIINYNTNLLVYPFTRFFPKLSNFTGKIFDQTFLSKINFFSSGFIISAKK
jgi:2-polyprenyl-3-methyl-5-hydroxy-6-metoxy-1,4-benzoquinol methylase